MAETPASLDEYFKCEKYSCSLKLLHCLQRQTAKRASGNPGARAEAPYWLEHCSSRKCAQGNAIAERFAGVEVPQPARVDVLAQQRAKKRAARPIYPVARERDASPEPEMAEPCSVPDCTRGASENGQCFVHAREPEPELAGPPVLEPDDAPTQETNPAVTPEAPAEESPMEEEKRICSTPGCGRTVRKDSSHDECAKCRTKDRVQKTCEEPRCERRLRKDGDPRFCSEHKPRAVEVTLPPARIELPPAPPAAMPKPIWHREDAASAPKPAPAQLPLPAMPAALELPDPSTLPIEYLARCSETFKQKLDELRATLTRLTA